MSRLDLAVPTPPTSPRDLAATPHGAPSKAPKGVVVLVPADRTRAWSQRLAQAVAARSGLPAELRRVPDLKSKPAIPSEDAEHRLFGATPYGHAGWVPTADIGSTDEIDDWTQRLVVNATGHDPCALPAAVRKTRVVSPVFNGRYELEALADALTFGQPPHLCVTSSFRGATRVLYGGRLAASDRPLLRRAMDAVLGRTIELLSSAVDQLITRRRSPMHTRPPAPEPLPAPLGFWARRLGVAELARVGRRLQKPFVREDWRVGLRPLKADRSPADLDLDPAEFHLLKTPPDRFYADPFVLRHDGVTALFFEDFDFHAGRAHISCMVLDEAGAPSPVRTVLKRPYHLSYPFVFSHEGAALMIPETSGNRTIELYEADAFPDRWRLRSVLVDGVDASDTTLHFDEATGLWWLFAAVSEFGSSSHDSLSLFFSPRLEGPWRPHPGNPVKLDPGCSRPAGPLLRRDGRLFRPTQDCTYDYGSALVWCEVTRLDPHAFRETLIAKRKPGRPPAIHTYGRAAGFEVIDLKGSRRRFLS